ncbi:MAG: hypothetical protein RR942_01145 [Romboutsia sp.]
MEFILISVAYQEKIKPYLEELGEFNITANKSKVLDSFNDEYELEKHIITLKDLGELVKLRDVLKKDIILEDQYYDSGFEFHENVRVLRIYDDYKE